MRIVVSEPRRNKRGSSGVPRLFWQQWVYLAPTTNYYAVVYELLNKVLQGFWGGSSGL